jgi:hypothetical protein
VVLFCAAPEQGCPVSFEKKWVAHKVFICKGLWSLLAVERVANSEWLLINDAIGRMRTLDVEDFGLTSIIENGVG